MLQFGSSKSPKGPCVQGLIPRVVHWEVVEPYKVGSGGRSLGHWGRALEGDSGTPAPPLPAPWLAMR